MLNLSRLATRVAIAATAGWLSACSAITFGIANAPAKFGPFERKADIPYGTDKRQTLDVYVPNALMAGSPQSPGVSESEASTGSQVGGSEPVPSSRPVVIFWYGGSWQNGSKADYR